MATNSKNQLLFPLFSLRQSCDGEDWVPMGTWRTCVNQNYTDSASVPLFSSSFSFDANTPFWGKNRRSGSPDHRTRATAEESASAVLLLLTTFHATRQTLTPGPTVDSPLFPPVNGSQRAVPPSLSSVTFCLPPPSPPL